MSVQDECRANTSGSGPFGKLFNAFGQRGILENGSTICNEVSRLLGQEIGQIGYEANGQADGCLDGCTPLSAVLISLERDVEYLADAVDADIKAWKSEFTTQLKPSTIVTFILMAIDKLHFGQTAIRFVHEGFYLMRDQRDNSHLVKRCPLPPPNLINGVYCPRDNTLRDASFNRVLERLPQGASGRIVKKLLVAHHQGLESVPGYRLLKAAKRNSLPQTATQMDWLREYRDPKVRNAFHQRTKPIKNAFRSVGWSLTCELERDDLGNKVRAYSLLRT